MTERDWRIFREDYNIAIKVTEGSSSTKHQQSKVSLPNLRTFASFEPLFLVQFVSLLPDCGLLMDFVCDFIDI